MDMCFFSAQIRNNELEIDWCNLKEIVEQGIEIRI